MDEIEQGTEEEGEATESTATLDGDRDGDRDGNKEGDGDREQGVPLSPKEE